MWIAHLRLDKADGVLDGHGHLVLVFFSAGRSAQGRDAVAGGAPRRATSDHGLRSRSCVWLRRTMYPVGGSSHGTLGIQAGKKNRHIAAVQKVAGDLALDRGGGRARFSGGSKALGPEIMPDTPFWRIRPFSLSR